MRFSVSTAAILALVGSVVAQTTGFNSIGKPEKNEMVPAGATYEITWTTADEKYKTGKVKISLIGGKDDKTLTDAGSIASGVDNSLGKYEWSVDSSLGDREVYGIVMTLESDDSVFQYSMPFHIVSDTNSTSTVTSATGTKTVSLSSVSSTVTSGNFSATATAGKSTMTTQVTATAGGSGSGSGSAPTGGPSGVGSGAAMRATAGSILGLVGFVLAMAL